MDETLLVVRATCPFFPGFYATVFDASDFEYESSMEMASEKNEEYKTDRFDSDMFELDYKAYQSAVCESYVKMFKQYASDYVEDVEFIGLESPKYYNFRNDEIIVDITLPDNWINKFEEFMKENEEWLRGRIREDWTSYDGFMSFMENDLDLWKDKMFVEMDERYISTMLAYMMYKGNERIKDCLIEDVYEDVCPWEHMEMTAEGRNLMADLYEENHQPGWDMTNQMEIDFD